MSFVCMCKSVCLHVIGARPLLIHGLCSSFGIKQWDQWTGKSARIVNIGPTIPICLIQMAMRSAHGAGISLSKKMAQKKAPNTGGATINNVCSEKDSVSCIA